MGSAPEGERKHMDWNTNWEKHQELASRVLSAEFLRRRKKCTGYPLVGTWFPPIYPFTCADGFSVSIQAGFGKYSSPREDFAELWTAWELGYPSERCEDLMPWVEDATAPTNTVYAMVPSWVVMKVLQSRGGWVGDPLEDLMDAAKGSPSW